jgi:predicted nucleic acid-binding protein
MSAERFTLDTNILVYSIDRSAGTRHDQARQIVELAVHRDCWLTLQAVSEFFSAASRKGKMPIADAAAQANDWLDMFPTLPGSDAGIRAALAAARGQESYWDALLLATAAEGGCAVIVTEDMADGVQRQGVRVLNPFGDGILAPAAVWLLAPD